MLLATLLAAVLLLLELLLAKLATVLLLLELLLLWLSVAAAIPAIISNTIRHIKVFSFFMFVSPPSIVHMFSLVVNTCAPYDFLRCKTAALSL
jgi:hypothetical protein